MLPGMDNIEVVLAQSNVNMLVSYLEALDPPNYPTDLDPAEAYRAGFIAARSSARRLVLDMWRAAEIATAAAALDEVHRVD